MSTETELNIKLECIHKLLAQLDLDALLLRRIENFSWLTCGADSYVNTSAGVKSEDTISVGEQTNEVLTEMADWPTIEVQIGGQKIKRPAILLQE